MTADEVYRDRARAESFGSIAARYDRYRLAPADAAIDVLVGLRPRAVLDVGCGTGKLAAALAGRGLAVLGVEPDERMAGLARGHGIPVEIATFETWDAAGRRFDLITSGDAWHWVDPTLGVPKAARLLRPGGVMARLWNHLVVEDESVLAAFDAVYDRHAPEITRVGRPRERTPDEATDPFVSDGGFETVDTTTFREAHAMTADEWVGLAGTTSDHQRLGPRQLESLLIDLDATIHRLGGTVPVRRESYLMVARAALESAGGSPCSR